MKTPNNNRVLYLLLFTLLAGVATIVRLTTPETAPLPAYDHTSHATAASEPGGPGHPALFYDSNLFSAGMKGEKNPTTIRGSIRGGIIPHHLYPSFILSDFFSRLPKQKPTRIIIVGPNHKEAGTFPFITSLQSWQTPFGNVLPHTNIINSLTEDNLLHIDEAVIETEHSVAGIMPYVKYYLPEASVVPIIIRGTATLGEVDTLAKKIRRLMSSDTVLIASVDFSHYLTADKAEHNDAITKKHIDDYDYEGLYRLNNDYLDSPPSITAFLKVMEGIKATDHITLFNTNSGKLQNNPYMKTTSYFSIAYF